MSAGFNNTDEILEDNYNTQELLGGEWAVDKLYRYLSSQSNVLELGSGDGENIEFLLQYYNVTGSEQSDSLLPALAAKHPSTPLLALNAVDLQTDLRFHCIYSNKVLSRLGKDEIAQSVGNQIKRLEPFGLVCHTFWKGEGEGFHQGLRVQKYTAQDIIGFFGPKFEIVELLTYSEIEKDDSLLIIAEKLA